MDRQDYWKSRTDIKPELNDAPIVANKTANIKNSDFNKLHDDIINLVLEFFKNHGLPERGYSLVFGIDELKSCVDFGYATPVSDSYLSLLTMKNDELLSIM